MTTDTEVMATVEAAFASIQRPTHFTNHLHCEECEAHDRLLLQHDPATLRVEHVNQPGSDPICFCSPHGKAYYMPALVRFALADGPPTSHSYWHQLLTHLEGDGPSNAFVSHCTPVQRHAVALFLEHLITTRTADIEAMDAANEILRAHGYWAPTT